MNSKIIKSKIVFCISVIILLITIFPLIYLSFFNHPCLWDDYIIFVNSYKTGYKLPKLTYGSRFSTQFCGYFYLLPINSFNQMLKFIQRYHLFSLIYVFFTTLSFFYFAYELNKHILKLSKHTFFFLYSLSQFLLYNFINASPELFYCHTVTGGYTLGIIFMFFFLGILIKYHYSQTTNEITISLVLLFLITFILSGCVEFFVLFAGYIAFYVFLFIKKHNTKKRDKIYFFVFIFCILIFTSFFVVNYFKTQTILIDAKYEESSSSLLNRIPGWCYFTLLFILSNIKKIIFSTNTPVFLLLFFVLQRVYNKRFTVRTFLFFLFLYPVILLMSFSGCYGGLEFFSLYSYPRNVFDAVFFIISVPFFYIVFTFILSYLETKIFYKFQISYNSKQSLFIFLSIIACISTAYLCMFSNKYLFGIAYHDILSGKARQYNTIQLENYKKLFSTKNDEIVFLQFPGYPRSIVSYQGNYIIYNPSDNSFYAKNDFNKFFKKKKIIYTYNDKSEDSILYIQQKKAEGENLYNNGYFD